jgi:hypothetical protein
MSITADHEPARRDEALLEPDWRALEDELAPICDELAHRFAQEYDESRRRQEYATRLAEIRRADERARLEQA